MNSFDEGLVPLYLLERYRYQVAAGQFKGSLEDFLRLQHLVWKTTCKEDAREWSLGRWLYEERKKRG